MKALVLSLIIIIVSFVNLKSQTDTTKTDIFDYSLEELMQIEVTTASKKLEPVDKAPNVMYVVTADDIKNKGFKNLKDVLQTIPGCEIFLHELGQNVQVRGIAANENEKVSIMINGRKIDLFIEPIHFDGAINLDNVKLIEIIIGPGSVLYGAETLEAIINIIPKIIDGTEVTLTTGTDKTISATINTGKEISEDISFMASLTYLQRDGYDAYTSNALVPNHINLIGKNLIEKIYPSIFLLSQINLKAWTFNFTHENLQTPEYMVISNKWGDDGNRYSYVNVINLKNEKKWTDKLIGTFQFHYDNMRQLRTVTISGEEQGPSFDLSQQVYGAEYTFQYTKNKHFFQIGLQSNYKLNRHNYVYVWVPETSMLGNQLSSNTTFVENMITNKNTLNIGLYLSEEYKLSDEFKLIAASRFDYDQILETNKIYISPRFSVIYSPNNSWILKAMYNKATRMPNTWESPLNKIYGSENKGPGYIEEEDFFSWAKYNSNVQRPEVLTDYEIQNIIYFGKTRFSLNMYYQELIDFISWNTPYTNVGDFKGYGGELSMNTIFNKFSILFTTSYNKNDFMKNSNSESGFDEEKRPENPDGEMLAVPKLSSYLELNYHDILYKGVFSAYIGTRYLTGIPMRIENTGNNQTDYTYANNIVYVNFNISWSNLDEKFRLDFSGKNIFNNQKYLSQTWSREFYKPRGSVFMLSLRYFFLSK